MGKLFDLAKGLTGEKSLHGRFGRWIQAVSTALDAGAATPDYGMAKKGPALAVIGVGDKLILELPGLIRGVTYQETQGNWILTPGKTYLLHGEGYFSGFSDAVTGFLDITWADDNDARLIGGGIDAPSGRFFTGASQAASVSMLYTVPLTGDALRVAKLYCIGATGTAQMSSGLFSATVVEIPG